MTERQRKKREKFRQKTYRTHHSINVNDRSYRSANVYAEWDGLELDRPDSHIERQVSRALAPPQPPTYHDETLEAAHISRGERHRSAEMLLERGGSHPHKPLNAKRRDATGKLDRDYQPSEEAPWSGWLEDLEAAGYDLPEGWREAIRLV